MVTVIKSSHFAAPLLKGWQVAAGVYKAGNQAKFAEMCGVSAATIQRMAEKEEVTGFSPDSLQRVVQALERWYELIEHEGRLGLLDKPAEKAADKPRRSRPAK